MSKILVLGSYGGGKSTSLGNISKLNIEGLNPAETFIIACTNKALPFPGWKKNYTKVAVKIDQLGIVTDIRKEGNYYISNNGYTVATLIKVINIKRPDIKNIVVDDSNYLMQDYYMTNSLKGGYDVFKKIGNFMGMIFNEMEKVDAADKNFIMMAHYEEFKDSTNDTINYRYKTVGKMVQDYITPEGKFEIVLFMRQTFDEDTKKLHKEFVTNFDGTYPSKTPFGMFDDIYIKNDLGYVIKKIKQYEEGSN